MKRIVLVLLTGVFASSTLVLGDAVKPTLEELTKKFDEQAVVLDQLSKRLSTVEKHADELQGQLEDLAYIVSISK